MNFGFSPVGLLFLLMLFVPNIIWSKNQPKDYEQYSKSENRLLLAFERIGEVLVTVLSLFCGVGFNFSFLLILGFIFLIIYELAWVKYFRSDMTMKDMLASFLKIPVPIASLPVLAFLILGIVSGNIFLIISSIILAIGHIGIHLDHRWNL